MIKKNRQKIVGITRYQKILDIVIYKTKVCSKYLILSLIQGLKGNKRLKLVTESYYTLVARCKMNWPVV